MFTVDPLVAKPLAKSTLPSVLRADILNSVLFGMTLPQLLQLGGSILVIFVVLYWVIMV